MRIVLADDERDFVDVLAERLSLRGHAVRVAPDGAAALAALAEAPSDILVLDWFMPGLSGPEVLTRVALSSPGLPVVLLSGHSHLDEEAFPAQVCAVLTKPLRFDAFLEILEDAAKGQRQTEGESHEP